ncbi:putative K domain-containing protein [Dioscorea sansibarensis]
MAFQVTPSKRPYERHPLEPNGRGKWQKTTPSVTQQNQSKASPGAVIFRLLCPISKFGSIIGKGGGIIAKIRQDTGAKIRIEETIPGCDERVVVITSSESDMEARNEHDREDEGQKSPPDDDKDTKDADENDNEKGDAPAADALKSEKGSTSAQMALLLVCERITEEEPENAAEELSKTSSVSVRLLVLSSQVGCILGKGGSVIKQMSADSGAQIRILPRDKLPLCASPVDEIVQIAGGIDSVRKAIQLVSQQLLEHPPRERDSFPGSNPSGSSTHPFSNMPHAEIPRGEVLPPPMRPFPGQGPPPFSNRPYDAPDHHLSMPPPIPRLHENIPPGRIQVSPEILTFRLLCSNDKVGSIIGKGGNIIKSLQHETGCEIKVLETTPESDDRIVVISGPSLPDDRISPAQDAILRIQERIMMASSDNNSRESGLLMRLIVSSNQTGCLLGKGGSVIAEMRKLSGAHIRILGKEQVPKSVSDNEEVINGEFRAIQDALIQITTQLRHHLFRDKIPARNQIGHPPFTDQLPPFGSYMGRRESPPPRMLHNLPPPFLNYDSVGRPHEDRPPFGPMHGPGMAPHNFERFLPPPWAPQSMRDAGGSVPIPDYAGAPQRRIGGYPGGSQPAVITNTTVDVVVPRSLVPVIYGEDGGCLKKIREISEAKITITEPRAEATETVIIISGTPDQTHAAQSLLQAFVSSESESP